MYTSGTTLLHILLGAGHDHGPRRPISDQIVKYFTKNSKKLVFKFHDLFQQTEKLYTVKGKSTIKFEKDSQMPFGLVRIEINLSKQNGS